LRRLRHQVPRCHPVPGGRRRSRGVASRSRDRSNSRMARPCGGRWWSTRTSGREDYRVRVRSFRDAYKQECWRIGVDHGAARRSTPFDKALMEYLLSRRAALLKGLARDAWSTCRYRGSPGRHRDPDRPGLAARLRPAAAVTKFPAIQFLGRIRSRPVNAAWSGATAVVARRLAASPRSSCRRSCSRRPQVASGACARRRRFGC
jgi:hypothetical protein